jgi:serine/threonine protein kinase
MIETGYAEPCVSPALSRGENTPHRISGKYEVLSQAGRGGMGIVYKVRHLTLDTVFALKVLPAEFSDNTEVVNRFRQEARVMAQFRHPNIVRVLDVDRDGSTYYFVMEYIEGKNLSQYLAEQGPLSVPQALAIARQVARALDYAHSQEPPVIHRDIKPQNILIEERSGRAVVTDFGIAKVLTVGEQTQTGLMLGTLGYCAPEQILQTSGLDGRADIYSLGLVLYEMVTKRPFFTGLDERALLGRILSGPEENVPTFDSAVPSGFVSLVARSIARGRERRYPRAGDLLQDIEACLALDADGTPTRRLLELDTTTPESAQVSNPLATKHQKSRKTLTWQFCRSGFRKGSALSVGLLALAFLSFQLVTHFQAQSREELRQVPPSLPLPLETRDFQESERVLVAPKQGEVSDPAEATDPVEEETELIGAAADAAKEPAVGEESRSIAASLNAQPVEQPLSPSRPYRVTILTAVRDNPTWTGKELALLRPNMRIHVVAHTGDWLKVESRSNPPKPPGYVWKADARPE